MTKSKLNLRNVVKIGVACLVGVTMFTGCKDNDSDGKGKEVAASKITATNVINSSSEITTVKAVIGWEDVIAQAPYSNNGFVLELPATVQDKYLELLINDEVPSGIVISDKTVKGAAIGGIEAFDKDDNNIGSLHMTFANENKIGHVSWFYVDKNVAINGESKDVDEEVNEEYIFKANMDLKKGWNVVYIEMSSR